MSNLKNLKGIDYLKNSDRQSIKIKSISVSRNDKSVLNVTSECGLFFKVHDEVAYECGLSPGRTIPRDVFFDIIEKNEERLARHSGLSIALRSSVSSKVLLQKLILKGFSKECSKHAVEYVSQNGYVSDEDYAANFIESKKTRLGRMRLRQELSVKGVSKEIVDEALESYSEDEELEGAMAEAEKRLPSLEGIDDKKKRERLMSFLLRRGYSYGIAYGVMKRIL